MHEGLLIAGMALLTFLPRYIPIALAGKVVIPHWLASALNYVPIAVLTVIIVQSTLIQNGEVFLSWQNHRLLAAAVALVSAFIFRQMLLTVVLGLLSFGLLEWFFPV